MCSRISPLTAFLLLFFFLGFQSTNTTTNVTVTNTIQPGQSLTTSDTIVSPDGNFQLCFYSPKNSTEYYLVIRYKKVSEQNVVWVANREYGFIDSSVVLKINQDGDLVISDSRIYSPLTNTLAGNGTYAMLLNTGNFVLTDRGFEVLWQSFDHPADTLLPGMTLGRYDWSLKSWKSKEDPAPGNFSLTLEYWYPKLEYGYRLTLMEGSKVYWSIPIDSFDFLSFNLEYVTWPVNNTSQTQFSRIVLDEYGKLKLQSWSEDEQEWNSSLQSSGCGTCGNFSICNETAQDPCVCLPGYKPVSADVWSKGNVSRDCVRKTALHCSNNIDVQNDGFLPMSRIDSLDSPLSFNIGSGKDCESACLNNCSCIAYAYEDNYRSHKNKSKCLVWTGSLSYLKQLPDDDIYGHDFYLKLSPLDLLPNVPISRNESSPAVTPGATEGVMLVRAKQLVTILAISLPLATLMLGLFVYCVWRKLRMTSKGEDLVQLDLGMTIKSENSEQMEENKRGDIRKKEVKMPLFSFASVSAATDNFSDANKLGEGGFGPVYKGILLKGDLVAVKRLSRRSGQGWEELKNEAMLIAKLQHNNLVRLLGCCIERDEKILIYEYMPNKSLDFFIFGMGVMDK